MTARTADRLAARQQTLAASTDEVMHFTLETRDDPHPEALRESIAAAFPGVAFDLAQLLPDEEAPLDRFFRLLFPGAPFESPGLSGFDVAYDLKDELDLASVEADAPFDAPIADGEEIGFGLDSSSGSSGGGGGGSPTDDRTWHLTQMRVQDAWRFSADSGRPAKGSGVVVTQPDTGWATHDTLRGRILPAWNWFDNNENTVDPLNYTGQRGHGTAVASVAVGAETPGLAMSGVAPEAQVRPFRAVQVVLVTGSNSEAIAQSIVGGFNRGSQVVSMSLGGAYARAFPPRLLQSCIDFAVQRGLVVVAAAGNIVTRIQPPWVTYPGWDPKVTCAGGSTISRGEYQWSCRGAEVAISAPALNVWRAWLDEQGQPPTRIGASEGTSYATANVAGVAALWIAHHGWQTIVDAVGIGNVQALYRHIVRATAHVPPGWRTGEFGAGIVDALGVLRAPLRLPMTAALDEVPEPTPAERLVELLRFHGYDEASLARIDEAFAERYAGELEWVLARRAVASDATLGVAEAPPVSETLAAAFPAVA